MKTSVDSLASLIGRYGASHFDLTDTRKIACNIFHVDAKTNAKTIFNCQTKSKIELNRIGKILFFFSKLQAYGCTYYLDLVVQRLLT